MKDRPIQDEVPSPEPPQKKIRALSPKQSPLPKVPLGPTANVKDSKTSEESLQKEAKGASTAAPKKSGIKAPATEADFSLDLPPMLSPTLPASIEAELAKLTNGIHKKKAPGAVNHAGPAVSAKVESVGDLAIRKTSMVVILKIKSKANRKQLAQYLKLKPTPKRSLEKQQVGRSEPATSTKGLSQSRPAKKELGMDESEAGTSLIKKHKPKNASLQKPSTPASQREPSPSNSRPSSSQAIHLATPMNIAKSFAMNRTLSQESDPTPLKPSRDVTPGTATGKADSPDRRHFVSECKAEAKKFVDLAREIKHDSDAYLKKDGRTPEEKKLGVVIATESTLSFILAATISDEIYRTVNQVGATDLWNSTRDFINPLAAKHARQFPHLYGLLNQIEGLVCDTLHYHFDVRAEAVFRKFNDLKAKDPAKAEEYLRSNERNLLKQSHEIRVNGRNAWREGEAALYHTELSANFPKTWAKQRTHPGKGKGRDPVCLQAYAKDGFALPMGPNSTGLEAVNFGLALLDEFCRKEKVEWKRKLKI